MPVKLLTEHHLEFLSFKCGCIGSSESTLVKMPPCFKSHVTAHIYLIPFCNDSHNNVAYTSIWQNLSDFMAVLVSSDGV